MPRRGNKYYTLVKGVEPAMRQFKRMYKILMGRDYDKEED